MKQFRAGTITTVVLGLLLVGYLFVRFKAGQSVDDPRAATPVQGSKPAPAGVVRAASTSGTAPRAALPDDAFEQLLASSPRLAAAEVADLPEATALRDTRLARLIEVWVEKTPGDAAVWAAELPNGDFRSETMQELGAAWGKVDTAAAAEWARQSVAAGQLIPASSLLSVWGRNDPTAAAEWLSALSNSAETNVSAAVLAQLSGALSYAWATSEPDTAAKWVLDQVEPGIRSQAIVNLAAGWAENDPSALAAWLKIHVQPDSGEAEAAYITLASHWADSHADSAGRWAASLPSGDLRDTTLATFASSLATSKPQAALQWSKTIGSQEQQREAALDIYETWLDDDLSSARDAIVATIPTLNERSYQHALYNLLHEKDPVFRDELYNLILPEAISPPADKPPAQVERPARPKPKPKPKPPAKAEPEIRRALPADEDPVDVKAMAE